MKYPFANQPDSKKRSRLHGAFRGNTLAEYVGIASFIVVVCIASITVFTVNFKNLVAQVRDDMRQRQQAPIAAMLARQNNAANNLVHQLSSEQLALLENELATKVQTTGANGSTSVLAQQLAALAEKMLADGRIDEAQYNILMDLSNQGHKMAQTMGMLEDALRLAGGDAEKFKSMTFAVDGQTYNALELSRLIGFDGPVPEYFQEADILGGGPGAGQQMTQFLDLYNQALASGALNDPAIRATVDSASTQIANVSEATEHNIGQFAALGSINLNGPDDLAQLAGASITNMNSSKICTAGNFTDNGTLCTP